MSTKNVQVLHQQACVLPRKGKYDLWVQSPNGTWMVLSGQWRSVAGARSYAQRAGYTMNTDNNSVLATIEKQLQLRFDDATIQTSH